MRPVWLFGVIGGVDLLGLPPWIVGRDLEHAGPSVSWGIASRRAPCETSSVRGFYVGTTAP